MLLTVIALTTLSNILIVAKMGRVGFFSQVATVMTLSALAF
jgi:hypothetical protein